MVNYEAIYRHISTEIIFEHDGKRINNFIINYDKEDSSGVKGKTSFYRTVKRKAVSEAKTKVIK